jgi:hypothetical protein
MLGLFHKGERGGGVMLFAIAMAAFTLPLLWMCLTSGGENNGN